MAPIDPSTLIAIIGPTASGKTAVGTHLADLLGGVVLSADSRQVYRGMDIGTGKDLSDYTIEGRQIPYYLIDICDAGEHYNLHRYREDFFRIAEEVLPVHVPKVLCGGTGLYMEAVLGGYRLPHAPEDPTLRAELEPLGVAELQQRLASYGPQYTVEDPSNSRRLIRAIEVAEYFRITGVAEYDERPCIDSPIVCIDVDREVRRQRISRRLRARIDDGMIEEIKRLLRHLAPEQLTYYGLEYRYVTEYVVGALSYDEMIQRLETAIHQFAKRQMTWIRGMERRGFDIRYVRPLDTPRETALHIIDLIY